MGEKARETLKLQFDKRLRLELHGARIISDAGLLASRELDGALGVDGGSADLSARDPRWPQRATRTGRVVTPVRLQSSGGI
jgi:hypothetical protein